MTRDSGWRAAGQACQCQIARLGVLVLVCSCRGARPGYSVRDSAASEPESESARALRLCTCVTGDAEQGMSRPQARSEPAGPTATVNTACASESIGQGPDLIGRGGGQLRQAGPAMQVRARIV